LNHGGERKEAKTLPKLGKGWRVGGEIRKRKHGGKKGGERKGEGWTGAKKREGENGVSDRTIWAMVNRDTSAQKIGPRYLKATEHSGGGERLK